MVWLLRRMLEKDGNANVGKLFTNLFDYLPLIALIESQV